MYSASDPAPKVSSDGKKWLINDQTFNFISLENIVKIILAFAVCLLYYVLMLLLGHILIK